MRRFQSIVGPDSAKVGQGAAFRMKWIKKDGDALVPLADDVQDSTRELLQGIKDTKACSNAKTLADLKKRKLVTLGKVLRYQVQKGPKYAKEIPQEATDLTVEMLNSGEWKNVTFKSYNFDAQGPKSTTGALHPLNKVRAEFRTIFFNMGFVEMPTAR
jgi:phenylalanyl-tRNA synthetase alpha chain